MHLPKPDYPTLFGQKFDEQFEALLRAAPPVFSFVYGIPSEEMLTACRQRGVVTIGTPMLRYRNAAELFASLVAGLPPA